MRRNRWLALALLAGCGHTLPPRDLRLDRVVLYQNGVGHFERRGVVRGNHLRLWLRPHEVDDVIKTLTVLDASGHAQQVAAALPTPGQGGDRVALDVTLSRPDREIQVSYAVPTATWKTTYRIALPSERGKPAVLQAWAMIDNVSEEAWPDVHLSLATGAPLSFATDLRTPHFVPRPDATGAMVAPTATGVVGAETARTSDGDGVPDDVDLCPRDAEDKDGFADGDGCPDPDNDRDRILDGDDKCPGEPETYNGFEDEDGCPDRGRVIVTDSSIQILDRIYFGAGKTAVPSEAGPLLDAVAQTLQGNPEITRIEIQGHAARDERDGYGLSQRRAAAVRDALVARGTRTNLTVTPYGDTVPAGDAAHSRRVEFLILSRTEPTEPRTEPPPPRIDAAALAASGPARAQPVEVAGATRFDLTDRVSVPRNASTLVSVLSRELAGEDALLYRPDGAVPGSEQHPFRAARIELPDDIALEPGPVAVYADGSFAGEGVATRTHARETTYVPFAVDGGTQIDVSTQDEEVPARLLRVERGVAIVENARVHRTSYAIRTGARVPARLFLRHTPLAGYTLGALPPDTERGAASLLVPVPLAAGRDQVLVVEERQPVERRIDVMSAQGATLGAYLPGSELAPELRARARDMIAARTELAGIDTTLAGKREQLADTNARASALEESLATVAKLPGDDAAGLRKRLVAELERTTTRGAELTRAIAAAGAARLEATIKVQTAIEAMALELVP